jgi:glycosyltransferase involved in cell wall biosynthesis
MTGKMTKPKLCYLLLRYSEATDRHYNHLYSFIDRLAEEFDLRLIIEQVEGTTRFRHVRDIVTVRPDRYRRLRLFGKIWRAYRQGYHFFYCHYTFGSAIFASLLTRLFGGRTWLWHCIMIDVLLKEHNMSLWSTGGLIFIAGSRVIQGIVTGSEFMRLYYHRVFRVPLKRIAVVPNYLNPKRFTPQEGDRERFRPELGLPPAAPVVLFVHGLEKGKGGSCLVPIARQVAAAVPQVVFLVVGDGSEKSQIDSEITRFGLDRVVRLVGRVANSEIHQYYRAADVFIMPSLYEEFSRTLLEAMASGLPFVASDGRGGTWSYTTPLQQRFIVPAGDNDVFARRLIHLLTDEKMQRELSQEGLNHIRNFTEEAVMESFLSTLFGQPGRGFEVRGERAE